MWLIWRSGSPDPSRLSPAVHHDDPAKDRDRRGWSADPIPILHEHRSLPIGDLLKLPRYEPPAVTHA